MADTNTTPYFAELMRQANKRSDPYSSSVIRALDATKALEATPTRTIPKGVVSSFIDTVDPYEVPKATPTAASLGTTGSAGTTEEPNAFFDSLEDNELAGNLVTGAYSTANSALWGLPGAAIKGLSPETAKRIQALRDQYPVASVGGEIAGAFVPTGGALLKGAGLGAKALGAARVAKTLDTAGDIVKGTKAVKGLSGAVGRGALSAAEEIVPRVLTGQQDAESGLLGLGLGAGFGAAGYGLSKVFTRPLVAGVPDETLDKMVSDLLRDTRLSGTGVNSKMLKAQLRQYAHQNPLELNPERVEAFKENLVDMFSRYKVGLSEVSKKGALAGIAKDWGAFDSAVDAVGIPRLVRTVVGEAADELDDSAVVTALVDGMLAGDPEVGRIVNTVLGPKAAPAAIKKSREIVERAVRGSRNYGEMSKTLGQYAFTPIDLAKPVDALTTRLASSVKHALDPIADELAAKATGMDIARMRKDYPAVKMLKRILTTGEMTVNKPAYAGSDTAPRAALTKLLQNPAVSGVGAMGGAAVGAGNIAGGIGDIADGDFESGMKRLGTGMLPVVAGTLGGQAINRLSAAGMNRGLAYLAGKIGDSPAEYLATKAGTSLPRGVAHLQNLPAQEEAPVMSQRVDEYGNIIEDEEPIQSQEADSKYYDFVEQRLWDRFVKAGYASNAAQRAALQGGDPEEAVRVAFNGYTTKAFKITNGFDVRAVAPYIFTDDKESGMFINLIGAMKILNDPTILQTATKAGGILGEGRAPANAMSQILIALDSAGVPDKIGGTPTKDYVNSLLRQHKKDPVMQRQLLLKLIRNMSSLEPINVDAALAAGGII